MAQAISPQAGPAATQGLAQQTIGPLPPGHSRAKRCCSARARPGSRGGRMDLKLINGCHE